MLGYNINVPNNSNGGSSGVPHESMTIMVVLMLPWLVYYVMYLINLRHIPSRT